MNVHRNIICSQPTLQRTKTKGMGCWERFRMAICDRKSASPDHGRRNFLQDKPTCRHSKNVPVNTIFVLCFREQV